MTYHARKNILSQRRRRIRQDVKRQIRNARRAAGDARLDKQREGLLSKTLGELRLMARNVGLRGYSKMKKDDIVDQIIAKEQT